MGAPPPTNPTKESGGGVVITIVDYGILRMDWILEKYWEGKNENLMSMGNVPYFIFQFQVSR